MNGLYQNPRRSICLDCCEDTQGEMREYYMVTDEVWEQGEGGPWMLCIGCLENRIGRELVPADFIECPLNNGSYGPVHRWPKSDRLLARMGR